MAVAAQPRHAPVHHAVHQRLEFDRCRSGRRMKEHTTVRVPGDGE
jgi:hypothetical protein